MTAFDEVILADLREWRRRIEERGATPPEVVSLTMPELDALLEAVAERDVLKREACAMPDEAPANVTPIRTVHYFGAARVAPVDLSTLVDAAVEEDERVIAWDAIAAHPFFRDCYGTKASLLEAMLAKLTASTFTADIPAEVRERAGERRTVNCRCSVTPILHDHPAPDEVSIEITAEVPEALREPGLLPFCDCGSVDKNGDDIGEHGPRCPYHLAVLGHVAAKTPQAVLDDLCKRTLAAQARLT